MTATRNEIDLIKADGLRGDNAEARLRFEEQRLGKLGQLFGARENAALYVVGLVLMLVLGLLGGLMFIDENLRSDLSKVIGGFGIMALVFICKIKSKN
jgi:hypothetical protein